MLSLVWPGSDSSSTYQGDARGHTDARGAFLNHSLVTLMNVCVLVCDLGYLTVCLCATSVCFLCVLVCLCLCLSSASYVVLPESEIGDKSEISIFCIQLHFPLVDIPLHTLQT